MSQDHLFRFALKVSSHTMEHAGVTISEKMFFPLILCSRMHVRPRVVARTKLSLAMVLIDSNYIALGC